MDVNPLVSVAQRCTAIAVEASAEALERRHITPDSDGNAQLVVANGPEETR